MSKNLICLPAEDVKKLIWRFDNFLIEQENELKYQRKNLEEIRQTIRLSSVRNYANVKTKIKLGKNGL